MKVKYVFKSGKVVVNEFKVLPFHAIIGQINDLNRVFSKNNLLQVISVESLTDNYKICSTYNEDGRYYEFIM